MAKTSLKRANWLKKKSRTKYSLGNLGKYPRLVVFRSNKHIYAQLIDDNISKTLLSSSTKDKDFASKSNSKINQSQEVGALLASKIKKSKIKKVIFDRNGYRYHGRVKALADTVRDQGIEI
tara:strand:- start:2024 stop:2386 length:363 start_codon:yes stop_codon:yes gene_type:complete